MPKSVETMQVFFYEGCRIYYLLQLFTSDDIRILVKNIGDTITGNYEEEWQYMMQRYKLLEYTPIEISN